MYAQQSKKLLIPLAMVILVLAFAMTTHASDVSDAVWEGNIKITNADAAATGVSVPFTLSTANMITSGMLAASADDCAIQTAGGTDIAFMPGWSANPWMMYITSIGQNEDINAYLYTVDVTGGKLVYFPTAGGMTTAYAADFIMGNNFEIEQRGWLDASVAGGVLTNLQKGGPSSTYQVIIITGTITINLNGVPTLSLAALTSGERILKYGAAGGSYYLKVYDATTGLLIDETTVVDATSINNNYNDPACNTFVSNSSMTWLQYQKVTINGTLQQHIVWQYATTFNDLSAGNHDATPSFRTTTSDADVSATLLSLLPTASAVPPVITSPEWKLITDVPSTPTGLFAELNMTFIGSDYAADFATNTGIPLALIVFPYAFGCAILAGLAAFAISKPAGGRGSFLAQATVTTIVLAYFVMAGGGVIPAWILIPFGLETLAALLLLNPFKF